MCEVIIKEDCESSEGFKLELGQVIFDVDELDTVFEGFTCVDGQITLVSVDKESAEKL